MHDRRCNAAKRPSAVTTLVRWLMLGLLSSNMAACATTGSPFAPRSAYSIDQDIADFRDSASITSLKQYYAEAESVTRRNEFVANRLALYDLEYVRFVSSFRLSRAAQSSAFDAIMFGLGLATTLTGPARTKTVLGAIGTAVTGGRASYEKNFYDDKTAVALVVQMNAERKTVLIDIIRNSRLGLSDYPMGQAITDLARYQFAGTVDGALAGIQRDAATKDVAATNAIERYRIVSWAPDANSALIKNWLWPGVVRFDSETGTAFDAGGTEVSLSAERYAKFQDELTVLGLKGLAPQQFFGARDLAPQRERMIKDLQIN